jgi:hypothetical protein
VRKYLGKICEDAQTHALMFSKFFPPENHAVYEIMWRNMVKPDRPQISI